jgi:prophage tail gpP-like protein
MSASAVTLGGPDEVTIQVGPTRFQGWQTVSITKSCETMPNSWALTASAQFLGDDKALAGTKPGQACLIYIGSDLVITGWIDRRSISIDAHNHTIMLSGRGITRNLVDCAADLVNDPALKGGQTNSTSLLDLAQKLSNAYGITVRMGVAGMDPGVAIPQYQVRLADTPYSIIESAARYAGFLVYEDSKGLLVLDRVGTQAHGSGFSLPGHVESMNAELSVDQRYSQYVVVWSGVDQYLQLGALINQRATKEDSNVGEHRLKIIVSEQVAPSPGSPAIQPDPGAQDAIASQRANWEWARRIGRSQAVSITCDSWRDTKNVLWTPNWLAPIEAPAAGVAGVTWVIGTVTYRKDMSGTHADLILMPRDAFEPDPNPLNLFDVQLMSAPRVSQSPAPLTTNPPS